MLDESTDHKRKIVKRARVHHACKFRIRILDVGWIGSCMSFSAIGSFLPMSVSIFCAQLHDLLASIEYRYTAASTRLFCTIRARTFVPLGDISLLHSVSRSLIL